MGKNNSSDKSYESWSVIGSLAGRSLAGGLVKAGDSEIFNPRSKPNGKSASFPLRHIRQFAFRFRSELRGAVAPPCVASSSKTITNQLSLARTTTAVFLNPILSGVRNLMYISDNLI